MRTRVLALMGVTVLVIGCRVAPYSRKATVTNINGDKVCYDTPRLGPACEPRSDWGDVGEIRVGDCFELDLASESLRIVAARRATDCPPR